MPAASARREPPALVGRPDRERDPGDATNRAEDPELAAGVEAVLDAHVAGVLGR